MFATRRLLQGCRITFFTRVNCSLCEVAAEALSKVAVTRPFVCRRIDLAGEEGRPWRELYDFDVPVIHISKDTASPENVSTASKAIKLMHRFTPSQIEAKMDEVEKSNDH
ncbi:glutaredoxin domain-containing protein [Ophiocordyceps camponoti-floridani]|uniref:Glutaredoxin-like protein n=1 Tax=Ophiocordyceps camponoti-floridani TaxID=2030778 RepID=A0A8H4Q7G8_9HYPO|nr:glutaredoxin domain-containing protein [Ophiocordyceps camponoti-floridani]